MIDICPAVSQALNWLPWVITAAALADVAIIVIAAKWLTRKKDA